MFDPGGADRRMAGMGQYTAEVAQPAAARDSAVTVCVWPVGAGYFRR